MQATKYGFEGKAHPCADGKCDPVSQCHYSMHKQGKKDYGVEAYGPGGTLIDTNKKFHVTNEFVYTPDLKKFWKLKTTLSQKDRVIEMEADCRDYLGELTDVLDKDMSLVLSSWDNTKFMDKFELD
jgi:hypothetical protein